MMISSAELANIPNANFAGLARPQPSLAICQSSGPLCVHTIKGYRVLVPGLYYTRRV